MRLATEAQAPKIRNRTLIALLKSPFATAIARLVSVLSCGLASLSLAGPGATVFENEALKIEFLEVGDVAAPGVDVPLRFQVENRGTVAIGGTLDIGGPTKGILPRSDPSQAFAVAPGQSAAIELRVAFAEDCVDGLYPVHAFFLLKQGRGDRGVLSRLIRPAFAAAQVRKVEDLPSARLATFRPAPVDNPVDRFLEERRLSVVADYARSLDEGAGRAFRLGPEEGAYRVLLVPGHQGMLDGYLYFSGPKSDLYFRGLRLTMQGPAGVKASGPIEAVDYKEEKRENGFAATHKIRLGEWESLLTIEVLIANGEVKIRADSPDPVVELSLGEVSLLPSGVTAGAGYHLGMPDTVDFSGDSPFLNCRMAQFEFADGARVAMGSDQPLRAVRVLRAENHASAAVPGRQWLRIVPGAAGVQRLAGGGVDPAPAAGGKAGTRIVPAIWFRRDCRDLGTLEREIKEWGRYESGPAGLLLDGWQAGGAERVPPDSWPPNSQAGGVQGLARFAGVCRDAGVALALSDSYGEISPAARGFQFDAVEFADNGRPVEVLPGATYAMRPDAALAYFEENWKQVQYHLRPGAAFFGGVRPAGHEFCDRDGREFPGTWVRDRWRANAEKIRKAVGDSTPVLAEGGGDWLAGAVDALIVREPPGLPPRASRVPWWSLAAGSPLLIEEVAANGTESMPGLAERLADGRLVLFGPKTWMHEALRNSWLLGPCFEQLRGRTIEALHREPDGKRIRVDWGAGLRFWSNGGSDPWVIDEVAISPGGFWLQGPTLKAGTQMVGNAACQRLDSAGERFIFPAYAAGWYFPVTLIVKGLTQLAEDRIELATQWQHPELIPPGASLRLYLSGPGERGTETLWAEIKLGDELPATIVLPAGGVPHERDWEVSAALENAGGGRLSCAGGVGTGGGLIPLGRIRRIEGDPPRWEATWRTGEEEAGGIAIAAGKAGPVDFGWGVSAGAFRLRKSGDHWRLYPLPGQDKFVVALRPAQIEGFSGEIPGVTGWTRKGGLAKRVEFRQEQGLLAFEVEPDVLVYDLGGPPPPEPPAPVAAPAPATAPAVGAKKVPARGRASGT